MFISRITGGIDVPEKLPLAGPSNIGHVDIRPKHVFIPMAQSLGKPCLPVVKSGDAVKLGQIIGTTEENIGSYVHASVSGTVIEISDMPLITGGAGPAVIIENDMLDDLIDAYGTPRRVEPGKDAFLETIKKAGVVGMGGATFPSHAKLQLKEADNIDLILVNGAECEPLLMADETLMCEFPDKIVRGAKLVMDACGARAAIAGVERDMPRAIACLRAADRQGMDFRVQPLPRHYPMGGEKQLIQYLTGKECPAGKMPKDIGVLVYNVATLAAIADAVDRSIPLVRRICTVAGDVVEPKNIMFPIGTLAKDMIELCEGFAGDASLVILGGPMMGKPLERLDVPLTKSSNGLIVINERHDATCAEEYPCIRCNRCSDACPMRLMPQFINACRREENWEGCGRFRADSCINCGCCAYVCPSAIPLAAHCSAAGREVKRRKNLPAPKEE